MNMRTIFHTMLGISIGALWSHCIIIGDVYGGICASIAVGGYLGFTAYARKP